MRWRELQELQDEWSASFDYQYELGAQARRDAALDSAIEENRAREQDEQDLMFIGPVWERPRQFDREPDPNDIPF
jgi:hypothetical protein